MRAPSDETDAAGGTELIGATQIAALKGSAMHLRGHLRDLTVSRRGPGTRLPVAFPEATPVTVVSLVVGLSAILTVYGGLRAFYFGGSFLAPIAYTTDERPTADIFARLLGTEPDDLLMGIHAFHDFLVSYYWGGLSNPWAQNALNFWPNHSPLAMLYGRFWHTFDYATARDLNLVLMALAMTLPAVIAVRRKPWSVKVLVVSVTVLSGPFIAALDRGNYQGYVPLLMFAFAYFAMRGRWGWAAAALVLAASFKVYPIVLVAVLVAERRWRALVAVLLGGVVLNAALFFAFEGPVTETMRLYLHYLSPILGLRESGLLSYNASFAGGVLHWLLVSGQAGVAHALMRHVSVLVLLGVVAVAPIVWMRRSVPFPARLVAAMMLTSVMTPVTYPYTANWAIAGLAVVVLASGAEWGAPRMGNGQATPFQARGLAGALSLFLVFSPVFIPHTMENGYPAGVQSLMVPIGVLVFSGTMWASMIRAQRRP